MDEWLKKRARPNQASGASRTYVVCNDETIVAYFALASGAVDLAEATNRLKRNMPDPVPVPVAVLGRLAIDRSWQKQGLGRALAKDAFQRVLAASNAIGIRGMLVHAISAEAAAFYQATGFTPSPLDPMTLMATLIDLRAALD
ncbi:GNAT family N-acetyltransferase [Methylocystis parvus]|uniref:GNAT family N-acetyltransferase n=2 Tax=Methylocystis parvus TaxID=134 RepID=A0A6B8MA75_9HYPH|nr:GNAT family N-acetyltransferase [Methylocystis parvus]